MGGEERQFDAVRGPGLIEDVSQVGLDGVLGNRGAFGNRLFVQPATTAQRMSISRRVKPKALLCRRAASASANSAGRPKSLTAHPKIAGLPALMLLKRTSGAEFLGTTSPAPSCTAPTQPG